MLSQKLLGIKTTVWLQSALWNFAEVCAYYCADTNVGCYEHTAFPQIDDRVVKGHRSVHPALGWVFWEQNTVATLTPGYINKHVTTCRP